MAQSLALEFDVSPNDALLLAVRRRAARVAWVDEIIRLMLQEHAAANPDVSGPPPGVSRWLAESRNEERLMVRAAKAAIDAGVAEAIIRRLELEGRLLMEAVDAGLAALPMLTVDQRITFLTAARDRLFALNPADDDGSQSVLPPLPGQIVSDPPHDDDDDREDPL